ncbi:MAG TPA: hypothetical protein VN901_02345 [Candidatus Acidoferrales bacterium]|nr:hypothetical protein [Candidatus Acidoferrales bacterium]
MHTPAGNGAYLLLSDHLAYISGITYFFEYGAEALLVTAFRRCREAHHVPSRVRVKEAEMFKDSLVGERHGVVRLVDDNEEEFFRAELLEPGSSGATGLGPRL